MVGGDGVGDILHEDGLTSLRLGYDERTLTFTDRREEVDNTNAGVGGSLIATEGELLLGEEGREVLESHTIANLIRITAIDRVDRREGEVFLVLMGRTHGAIHHIAGLQTILLNLLGRYVDIIGRRQVVIVGTAEESVAVGEALEHAIAGDEIAKVVLRHIGRGGKLLLDDG